MTPDRSRAVVDTNVVVSTILFPGSRPFQALQMAVARHVVLSSTATLNELRSVLARSKFESRLSLHARMRAFSEYERATTVVNIAEHLRVCRDPRDDKFLELAVSGSAEIILSGDADLLALHPFRNIAILTPAGYLASLEAK